MADNAPESRPSPGVDLTPAQHVALALRWGAAAAQHDHIRDWPDEIDAVLGKAAGAYLVSIGASLAEAAEPTSNGDQAPAPTRPDQQQFTTADIRAAFLAGGETVLKEVDKIIPPVESYEPVPGLDEPPIPEVTYRESRGAVAWKLTQAFAPKS